MCSILYIWVIIPVLTSWGQQRHSKLSVRPLGNVRWLYVSGLCLSGPSAWPPLSLSLQLLVSLSVAWPDSLCSWQVAIQVQFESCWLLLQGYSAKAASSHSPASLVRAPTCGCACCRGRCVEKCSLFMCMSAQLHFIYTRRSSCLF